MQTLITKTSIARLLNADPRLKILADLIPVALLLNGRTTKELFPAEIVEQLQANTNNAKKQS
jgi:hypothetical protein